MQDHALCSKFLLDRTGHISSSFDCDPRPIQGIGPALFRASRSDMQARVDRRRMSRSLLSGNKPKNIELRPRIRAFP
jgi:hypothetical protein